MSSYRLQGGILVLKYTDIPNYKCYSVIHEFSERPPIGEVLHHHHQPIVVQLDAAGRRPPPTQGGFCP